MLGSVRNSWAARLFGSNDLGVCVKNPSPPNTCCHFTAWNVSSILAISPSLQPSISLRATYSQYILDKRQFPLIVPELRCPLQNPLRILPPQSWPPSTS